MRTFCPVAHDTLRYYAQLDRQHQLDDAIEHLADNLADDFCTASTPSEQTQRAQFIENLLDDLYSNHPDATNEFEHWLANKLIRPAFDGEPSIPPHLEQLIHEHLQDQALECIEREQAEQDNEDDND